MTSLKLGMGMLRLPVFDGDDSRVNHEKTNELVDAFLSSGYNYFDTSYVYHGGKSEEATRKCVVERHPRESFTVTSKFPTFFLYQKEDPETIFQKQLKNCAVEYFDYYLLHNVNETLYDDVIEKYDLFGFIKGKKEAGLVKNIGFSFHDRPELLDRMLSEHPEVDFVQIVVNYFDWTSCWVRSKECYEVIRKHGKKVIIMEPVKGGMLAHPPKELADKMQKIDPGMSPASWAFRFLADLDGVIAVLSGMSTLEQVQENTKLLKNITPLNAAEKQMLIDSAPAYRKMGPLGKENFDEYKGVAKNGMPVEKVLEVYNTWKLETSMGVGANADTCYYRSEMYRAGVEGSWVTEPIFDKEGNDITELLKEAEKILFQ